MVGIAFTQVADGEKLDDDVDDINYVHKVKGFFAVFVACVSSGYAGVFYEKLLKKGNQPSVIIRNLQLGLFSLCFSLIGMVYYTKDTILEKGIFYGYTLWVVLLIILQSAGGLLIAATMKYADNILKGFATSFSVIIASLGSFFLLRDLVMGPYFIHGSVLVLVSSILYSYKRESLESTLKN